ncbi:MAG: AraC family transcriptional regulator [Cohnella sp.]|jgi:AraC-like DNA-binding protein|nr:AraC family transcriptional regulator [Cohnella sp.]
MKLHLSLPMMDSKQFLCFPESVGRYKEMPDHDTERLSGSFPFFNLHLVADGEGYVEENGKWRLLQQGDAFLFFPMQPQKYRSSTEKPWDVYWMHFYGHRLDEFMSEKGLRQTQLWSIGQKILLEDSIERLIREIENHKLLRPSVISTLAYGVLSEFLAQAIPHLSRSSQDTLQIIIDLLPEMQHKACEPFLLESWAEMAGISSYYFCKMFRKATQLSPMDFVTLCRIHHAKQLLLDDRDKPIHQLAAACGYPSVSYFIKRFKLQEGVTPSEYRKLHL